MLEMLRDEVIAIMATTMNMSIVLCCAGVCILVEGRVVVWFVWCGVV